MRRAIIELTACPCISPIGGAGSIGVQTILPTVHKKGARVGSGVVSVVGLPVNPTARPSLFSDTPGNKNNNSSEYISILGCISGQAFDVGASAGGGSRGLWRISGGWVGLLVLGFALAAIAALVWVLKGAVPAGAEQAGVAIGHPTPSVRSDATRHHSPVGSGAGVASSASPVAGAASQPPTNPAVIETMPDAAAHGGHAGTVPPVSAEARAASLAVAESLRKLNAPEAIAAPAIQKAKAPPPLPATVAPEKPMSPAAELKPSSPVAAPVEAPVNGSDLKKPSPSGPSAKSGASGREGAARDPDVDLILALMRHSDSAGPARSAGSGTSLQSPSDLSIASLVGRCKTLAGVDAKLCRQRICAGYWGRAEACPAKMAPKKAIKKPGTAPRPDATASGAAAVSGSQPVSASAN